MQGSVGGPSQACVAQARVPVVAQHTALLFLLCPELLGVSGLSLAWSQRAEVRLVRKE